MTQNRSPNMIPQYGGKPILYSTEPLDIEQSQAQFIEASLTQLLKNVENFTTDVFRDRKLLKSLGLSQDLDATPTPLGLHIPFARFDFIFDGQNLQVLELNTDGTSGYNTTEWVAEFSNLTPKENPNFNLSAKVLQALREHSLKAKEVILVDVPAIQTSWEQHDLLQRWGGPSQNCHFATPEFKSWSSGALAFRRILSWQLRANKEKYQPFLQDWADNEITVVGGWSSDVGMSKAWPAFLKSPFCPETVLISRETVKRLENEREVWVVKGALSYTGQEVIRGMDLVSERWLKCLKQILAETENGRQWIAQKKIDLPLDQDKPYELGLYFLNGKPSGYMCRWGHSQQISETSEEILRPVRIIS